MHGMSERDGTRADSEVRRIILLVVSVVNLLLLDAVTKELAVRYLDGSAAISVVDGFFSLCYVENRGCAWGMFQGQVWPLAIFGIVALVFLVWKRREVFGLSLIGTIAEPLLYAGIIGNLIDRVVRGCVIDFINLHWRTMYAFPCFNIADICISLAAALLLFTAFRSTSK